MKMAEVCQVFLDAGMQNVSSVLASGNILFQSGESPEKLKHILEEAMSAHFAYEAFLFIKTEKEIQDILDNTPFSIIEHLHLYIFIGSAQVEQTLLEEFEKSTKDKDEKAGIANDIFYWQVPKGQTLHSTFGNVLGKKSLKAKMTSRNINTFKKIIKQFNK